MAGNEARSRVGPVSPLIVYFDTNAVRDLRHLRAGVESRHRDVITSALRAGKLIVPASQLVGEELLSTAAAGFPEEAREAGSFYVDLISPRHCLRPTGELVDLTMLAIARRTAMPSPYLALSEAVMDRWREMAALLDSGGAKWIASEAGAEIARHQRFMTEAKPDARKAVLDAQAAAGRPLLVEDLWRLAGARYAALFAQRVGVQKALRGRYASVFQNSVMRAAIGGFLALVRAQLVNDRESDRGDSRDLLHLILAAAVKGPLVTGDGRLRKLVAEGDLRLGVLTVRELAAQLA
jgi:hypothetical protein